MSSDSDEELLQMALKEQAQRDLSYPNQSKKPVVDLVQRPASSRNPNPKSASGKPPKSSRVDDDEDSEVELLSISSGDEEVPRDRQRRGGGKGRAARAEAAAGDPGWDGEEPACWKHVDEAELARRVRDMREARVAPPIVVPTFERKASQLGKKGLTHLQSMPRGVEALDPLGLGIIDSRSLMLITDASESSPTAPGGKAAKDISDPNEREKINYYSEKFDSKLFLSRVHKYTTAADLESGALSLKTDLKGRTQQRKQLVKENFDCFVSCKTTIDDIESKMKQIEEDPDGSGTAHLYEVTQKISSAANRAFQPLFERQVQAEKIRSVQGMLQRFRTLFNLPSAIRGSISKGEYDLAVREYKKAKSIVLPSHVGILKRVLEEVEKVMNEFKATLYKTMEDPHLELAELENTVRLLLELEPDSDPVWHYLNIQNRRIRGLFEKCTADHDARLEMLHNEVREKELSDSRWRQLQQNSNKSSDANSTTGDDQFHADPPSPVDSAAEDSLRQRYIHRLTSVLLHHFPAFWRLALSVFSGKFAKVSTGNVLLESETHVKTAPYRSDDKAGDMKYSSHTLEEVAGMMHGTLSIYEIKVLNVFRDYEESNILSSFMVDSIKEVANACHVVEAKEAAPTSAVKSLQALRFEITKIYIMRLCSWMRATIGGLSETWIPLSVLERNRSPYTISYLPLDFRTSAISSMDRINLMIQGLRNEATKSGDMFVQLQEIQESVRIAFLNCFVEFAGHLERIGGDLSQNKADNDDLFLHKGFSRRPEGISSIFSGTAVTDPHKRILIVLSNIGFCKDELSEDLYMKYKHIWLQPGERDDQDDDVRDLATSFSSLQEKVLEQYTFAKANLIRDAAQRYILDPGIQWGSAPVVKGVRDATIELMNTLVSVHAEVSFGAKPLLEKTLHTLVEGLIDTFISLFHEYKTKDLKALDSNGFCQLMIEIEYFETVLDSYFSPEARQSLSSLKGFLLEKASESASEPPENPGHTRRQTRGNEDAMNDERQQTPTAAPDDLLALAQQHSCELLEIELERTRLNITCFRERVLQSSAASSVAKSAHSSSFQGAVSSPAYRTAQTVGSPGNSRARRR